MSSQLIAILKSQTNGAADGTGIAVLETKAKDLLGGSIPSFLIDYVQGLQLAIFGSYPDSKDTAPSAVFTAVFIIFFFAHLFIFVKNYTRGHKFWLSLGFVFYCFLRWMGFVLRIVWSTDIMKLKAGMVSEVFIILPTIFLASFNLVLAQRIFTWRHPVFGSSRLFWTGMITIYVVVVAVVVMTIIASLVPYLYLLSERRYDMCKNVQKVSAVLVVLYSVAATTLTAIAFVFKQRETLNTTVYQPWWIESFSPTYFVKPHASQLAEESFMLRDHNARHSIRIIASSSTFHQTVENQTTDSPNNLKQNFSLVLIALTSLFILIGAIFRAVCTFLDMTYATQSWIFKPVVMYTIWGVLESIVNVLYLVGRVDLRFYRPDRLPKKVREVKTPVQHSVAASISEKDHSSNQETV